MPNLKLFPSQNPLEIIDPASALADPNAELNDISEEKAKELLKLPILEGGWKGGTGIAAFVKGDSNFSVEVVNEQNPETCIDYKQNGFKGKLKEEEEEVYPWSYQGDECALKYKLSGAVEGGVSVDDIPIYAGIKGGFGLNGSSDVVASHIKVHPKIRAVGEAIDADLASGGGFRLSLLPGNLDELVDGEYLVTEYEGKFGFSADVSWGEIFSVTPGLVGSVLPSGVFLRPEVQSQSVFAEMGAKAGLKVSFATRLELIAHRVAPATVRLEYRKASSRNSSGSASFKVDANILDKQTAEESLKALLSQVINEKGEVQFPDVRDKLSGLIEKLKAWRGKFDFTQYIDSLDDKVKVSLEKLKDSLNVDILDLVALNERYQQLNYRFKKYADQLFWGDAEIQAFKDDIEGYLKKIGVEKLPGTSRSIVEHILIQPGFESVSFSELGSLLLVPDYLERIEGILKTGVPSLLNDESGSTLLAPLEVVRAEIFRLLENLDQDALLSSGTISVLGLVENSTGIPVSQLISDFNIVRIIDSLTPDEIEGGLSGLVESVYSRLDEVTLSAAGIIDAGESKIGEALHRIFGVPFSRIPEKINDLSDRIASAVSSELKASAAFEFQAVKESEALLSFDYTWKHAFSDLEELEGHYLELLRGNWDPVVKSIRAEGETGGSRKFLNPEFYALKSIERRASSNLRILVASFERSSQSQRQKVENLAGDTSYEASELSTFEGKNGKKRFWNGVSSLRVNSTQFYSEDNVIWKDFERAFETGFTFSARVDGSSDGNTKGENREFLRFLASQIEATNSVSGVSAQLERFIQGAKKDRMVTLHYHLVLSGSALTAFFESVSNGKYRDEYKQIWSKALSLKKNLQGGLSADVVGNPQDANNNDYFSALEKMADVFLGDSEPDGFREFTRRLRRWRWQNNRTGGTFKKLDKHFRPLAMMKVLRNHSQGCTVTVDLKSGNIQAWFGAD